MHSVHDEILTEATPKDEKLLWSHVGFGVTGSWGYLWRILWLLWRVNGPINVPSIWWPVDLWQPEGITFRLPSTPFSIKRKSLTNIISFFIGQYKAGILCLAFMKFQINNASPNWNIFLLSSCIVVIIILKKKKISFPLPGNTCSVQMGKALTFVREAKKFSEFMEGERAEITGAWLSALPAFPEVPKPVLSMGVCDILMAPFLSACGNVFVHQAAQKRADFLYSANFIPE